MADHKRRFERWRKKLPKNTIYLVDQVLARIVPVFEDKKFCWYPDYAGGAPGLIGFNEIALQKRQGEVWPTVHIQFDERSRPYFSAYFSILPLVCRRLTAEGIVNISRENAIVVDGPAYFSLRKGAYTDYRDGNFGYSGLPAYLFSLSLSDILGYRSSSKDYLDREIDQAIGLLPFLFQLFDRGIPKEWLDAQFGYVSKNVMLLGSWKIKGTAVL